MNMEPYTTTYGTKISTRILHHVYDDIIAGVDDQKTLNDWLRDPIPEHAEDMEEAYEVYSHVEYLINDAEAEATLNGDRFPCYLGHVLCATRPNGSCLNEYYANRMES